MSINNYQIQQDYFSIKKGEVKTVGEWCKIFHFIQQSDFSDEDWFLPADEKPKEWVVTELRKGSLRYFLKREGVYDVHSMPFDDEKSLEFLLSDRFYIHSVIRVSDNTVFSIGDFACGVSNPITAFSIHANGDIWIDMGGKGGCVLSGAVKTPQPPVDTDAPFQWDEKQVEEFVRIYSPTVSSFEQDAKEFKEARTIHRQEDKIRVIDIQKGVSADTKNLPYGTYYAITLNSTIPPEKYPLIKKAIEEILSKK